MSLTRSRNEQRLQLNRVAVNVPVGKIGILRMLPRGSERAYLPIEPDVIAIVVAEEVRRQRHVIEGGIEDLPLVRSAAFDRNAIE